MTFFENTGQFIAAFIGRDKNAGTFLCSFRTSEVIQDL